MKECAKFQADLTDYARGEEKYVKDLATLFSHLKTCAECRNKFWDLKELFGGLRTAEYKPSPEFTRRMEELKELFRKGPPPEDKSQIPMTKSQLQAGIELYQRQKWFEAAKVFDELVKAEPDNANAYYHRGLAHQRMNLLAEAVADFTRAVELDKDDADAYFHRASVRYQLIIQEGAVTLDRPEKFQSVISDLERATRLNPDYYEAYFGLGMISEQLGEWEKAVADFTAVLEGRPADALALFHRGVAYARAKSLPEARADFQQVLQMVPDEPAAHLNIGITYAMEGKLKEAIKNFQQTLKIDPKYADAREAIKLAQVQMKALGMGRPLKAKAKVKKPARELEQYRIRIKELEAENKTLKQFQAQLLEVLRGQRVVSAYQGPAQITPEPFQTFSRFAPVFPAPQVLPPSRPVRDE